MCMSDAADANQNPNKIKRATDKSASLLDALRDPKAVKDEDFVPGRVDFGGRHVKFRRLSGTD